MNIKIFVVLALALVAVQANKAAWDTFKINHEKSYKSIDEEVYRYRVFQNNLKTIEDHNEKYNQGLETYSMAVNQFGDLTTQEFLSLLKVQNRSELSTLGVYRAPVNDNLASEVDWRTKGAVTEVKDQGLCGSCWSFSATGSLEGQNFLKNGKLISLSEQNLIDCSGKYNNYGCDGGLMTAAFDYIRDKGIETESDYPYKGTDGRCKFSPAKSVLKVKGYKEIDVDSESDLQSAVANVGPVSVAIDATENLQFYSQGLFNDMICSADALNHGVLAVGYGSEGGNDYWIVKNSWGSAWGEKGYVRMARNKKNQCGIASMACYPLL